MIQTKRVYAEPLSRDGVRILVDRVWPRGISKQRAHIAEWRKDLAPSTQLRRWFGHEVERWEEFRRRYRRELNARPGAWKPVLAASRRGPVTLLYSARDVDHNGAIVLREFLL